MCTGSGSPASTIGPHRSEHPLLVVAEGLRRARDEDDPSAVAIDVAFEERHAVLVGGRLHRAHESVERVRSRLGPFGLDDLVGPGEADERDRRVSMLALERPDLEKLRAQRRRNRDLERDAFDGGQRRDGAADLGSCTEESPVALLLAERVGFEDARRLCAHEDLAGLRCGLHLHRSSRCRACDQKLAMRLSDEEELEAAAVKSRVHLELDRPGRRSRPTDRAKRSPHLECRASGSACVLLAVVEQQQRVAAELEQAAALCVRDAEERGERRVHHLGDLLGARSAEAREALRHRGEARDVDECDGSLDLAPRCRGLVAEPLERQPRDERDEIGRRRGERVRRSGSPST